MWKGGTLAKFAQNHRDLKMAALFTMSDQTLGGSTIDESEARLNVIDESVNKLSVVSSPKSLAPEVTAGLFTAGKTKQK